MSFSFFSQEALVTPAISEDQARNLVREHYGISGAVSALGSQQDANFLVESATHRYVLKVSNPAFAAADLVAQNRAAALVRRGASGIRVPVAVAGLDGQSVQQVRVDDVTTSARLVTYVDGDALSACRYLAPVVVSAMGELAARISLALNNFDDLPARELQWDLRHAHDVVHLLADFAEAHELADAARTAADAAQQALAPVADFLAVQVVHGDLSPDNVIAEADAAGRMQPVGVIDFGDLTRTWAVSELAVTCASLLAYSDSDPTTILPAIRAFDALRPLTDDELSALWPLVVLRAAALLVSGRQQATIDDDNRYAADNLDSEWRIFREATAVPIPVMTRAVRLAVRGASGPERAVSGGLLVTGPIVRLDASATSPDLVDGWFLDEDADVHLAAGAVPQGLSYLPYLQPRLTRTEVNSARAPETVATGIEMFTTTVRELRAPWPGTVEHRDDAIALRGAHSQTLWLTGPLLRVRPGTSVRTGDVLAHVDGAIRVQVSESATCPPFFVPAALAAGWSALCPDPTPLVDGSAEPAGTTSDQLLARRDAHFASVQEHYYPRPPQIERGWRHHLFDTDGRAYLDMVNNVSILGHGHPRLAAAVERQWRLLNTNSRFHYRAVAEYAGRLADLLPAPLDTVLLVNSGTEANDLALRLAWAATGRRDVVAVREAYHGWSDATDAISTSVADNPNALTTRPDWVHTVAAPNAFRGMYRGPQAHRYAEDAVRDIVSMERAPAAFLCEPFYGNAGGMALPDGYLSAVYAAVRSRGGLCISDEVQVGYGRLGEHFWGFEQQRVVPDIVTVAKAIGNGHPLGAVITTAEIAAAYRSQGYFFSSAGGSPVSCVAGITVLDVLEDEGLQRNARTVGAHLRSRLLELADRHPIVGAVHGMGLYIGVELVRDRDTLEPAPEETAAVCERMLELGVVVQPTSDRMCVLKIKPPLGIGSDDADFFVDTLDRVLTEGW